MNDEQTGMTHFFTYTLWREPHEGERLVWLKRQTYPLLRMFLLLGHSLVDGQLTLRAMSLVYTTLLSIVPLLAVSFSLLKAFGAHNQIEPLLTQLLAAQLGPVMVEEVVGRILGFVENMKVGVLGAVGFGFLLFTVISLLKKIEDAFNFVWRVKRRRGIGRQFTDYLSVTMVGPALIFTALGMSASLLSNQLVQRLVEIEPFGTLLLLAGKLVPYLFVIGAFTFIYVFIPNTKVRLRSALFGAAISGVLWQTSGMLFAIFVRNSTQTFAVYSSFAILILFMMWLYISWLILLFGATAAYYHQHPRQMRWGSEAPRLSNRMLLQVTLLVAYLIARRHHLGKAGPTLDNLASRFQLPVDLVEERLARLIAWDWVVESADEPPRYLPAKEPRLLDLEGLYALVASEGENALYAEHSALRHTPVDEVLSGLHTAEATVLQGRNLAQLVAAGGDEEELELPSEDENELPHTSSLPPNGEEGLEGDASTADQGRVPMPLTGAVETDPGPGGLGGSR